MPQHMTQAPAAWTSRASWQRLAVGIGLLAVSCAVLLLLTAVLALRMPVSLLTRNADIPPAVVALRGSIMVGQATLEGGYTLRWDSAVRFLPLPHLRSDAVLEGADTRLTGWARAGVRGLALNTLTGRAGPGLAQLLPGAWTCNMTATVSDVTITWGMRRAGGSGAITTPEGTCTRGAQEAALPPLRVDFSNAGEDMLAGLSGEGIGALAQITLARARHLDIAIEPVAADIFPVLPRGGPIRLQLPF